MQALSQITGAMDDIDTILNKHLRNYTQVLRHYTPYEPGEWTQLLRQVHQDFGRPSERWTWMLASFWSSSAIIPPRLVLVFIPILVRFLTAAVDPPPP